MRGVMNWIKVIFRWVMYAIYLLMVVGVVLEIIFRLLPTTAPIDLQPITDKTDILRFQPNEETTFSLGKDFYQVVEKSTNNYGFYSSYDYLPNIEPNIVVVGDSYVEAAQIRNQDSIGEVLQSENPNLIVYQIGVSGVPLSQYIQMIRYAKSEFSAQHYVIVVVGNDFDQSLCSYRRKEGTWCFNTDYELAFIPFDGYSLKRQMGRSSAFIRYLVFQGGLDWRNILARFGMNDAGLAASSLYAGNTERMKSDEITAKSRRVITRSFEELVDMDLTSKVTIILDADRNDIYQNKSTDSYFNDMRRFMIESAVANNVSYIDMDPIFREDFSVFGERFEFRTDGHWNERAHRLAAQRLAKQILSQR